MRFPFFRNRDSVKNGILISIRRTGDGFHPGLFTDEEETNSQIYFRKQIKETPADHKFTVCRCSLSFHKISINAIPVPEMPFIKARFRYSVPDIFVG